MWTSPGAGVPKPFIFFELMAYGTVAIIPALSMLATAVVLGIH
jgi:hypothetical protein